MPESEGMAGRQTGRSTPSKMASRAAVTILLVDDDALVRSALRAVLSYAGFNVVTCEGGAAAVSLFQLWPKIDVLLTDFQMPEMTGLALAEELTRRSPLLPAVMVSGASQDEIPLEAIEQRAWSFLPKPVDRETLLSVLDRVSGGPARAGVTV
jgi:DNA-binding NtrC family response regulator